MSQEPGGIYPPSVGRATAARVPLRWRRDAAQEAWVAYLEGKDPNSTVRTFLNRAWRREQRFVPFSQLNAEIWEHLVARAPW